MARQRAPRSQPWRPRARGWARPGRDHPRPGGGSASRPAAAPPWADGRLGVRVLSRRAGGHGARPVDDAAQRHHRPGMRRRPPVQLRPVRLARTNARLRLERLRRDAARTVGVGRQAAGGQRRDRRPEQRVHAGRGAHGDPRHGGRLSRPDGALLGDAAARHLVRPDDRGRHREPDDRGREAAGHRRSPQRMPGAASRPSSPRPAARTR